MPIDPRVAAMIAARQGGGVQGGTGGIPPQAPGPQAPPNPLMMLNQRLQQLESQMQQVIQQVKVLTQKLTPAPSGQMPPGNMGGG